MRTNIWWPDEIGIIDEIPEQELEAERARREVAMQQIKDYYAAMKTFNEQQCERGAAAGDSVPRPERPNMTRCRIWANGCWNKRLYNHEHEIPGWGTAYLPTGARGIAQRSPSATSVRDTKHRAIKFFGQPFERAAVPRDFSLAVLVCDLLLFNKL